MDDDDEPKDRKTTKKVAKKDMYQALVVVIDISSTMKKAQSDGTTAIDCAREAVDWIITRKIFTQSNDRMNIVLVGGDGVHLKDHFFVPSDFDHFKFLQERVQLTENVGNVTEGLAKAVEELKKQRNDLAVESRSILLITNGESNISNDQKLRKLGNDIIDVNSNLVIMGIEPSSKNGKSLEELVDQVGSTSFHLNFREASTVLNSFTQKKIAARAMKKRWEILPGIFLPLAFHMRSTPAKNPLKTVTVNEKGEEVKREHLYFVKDRGDDFMNVKDDPKGLEKSELLHGYLFGKSKVVLSEDDIAEYGDHNFNEKETGGSLKLLQFTKRSNILPSFFIGTNSYTVVPAYDKKTSNRDLELMKVTLSLIEGMLQQDTIAVCRYAYHASAHLQLMALLPRKDEETGQLYMTAIRLPFMDDWRPFALPDVTLRGPAPTAEKLAAIDDLIDAMDLSKTDNSYDDVLNPFFQRQCTVMKAKAMKQMGLDNDINLEPSIFLKRGLEPDPNILESEEFTKVTASLNDIFSLEEVIRIKRSRKDITAQNKDYLKGIDDDEEEDDEAAVKDEIIPIAMPDPEGPHKKFWDMVRKALESGGNAINKWIGHVSTDMSLFDEGSLAAVEKFKILRAEMLLNNRTVDFNKWMMSLHGNDEYSDFFQFMDSHNEAALITLDESPDSWYTVVESEMFWAGLLEDEKKVL